MIDSGVAVAVAVAALAGGIGLAFRFLRGARAVPDRTDRRDVVAARSEDTAASVELFPVPKSSDHAPRAARPRGARSVERTIEDVEEQIFWFRLLSPLDGADPALRERWLVELASRPHHHPRKGKQFFDRATLQRQLERVQGVTLEELQARLEALRIEPAATLAAATTPEATPDAAPKAQESPRPEPERGTIPLSAADPDDDRPRGVETEPRPLAEEIFWFNLLAPLREVPPHSRRDALVTLGARPHHHPLQGHRLFDVATLERELTWVVDADPEALNARWHAAAFAEIGMAPDTGARTLTEIADERSGSDSGFEPLEEPEVDSVLESRLSAQASSTHSSAGARRL